MEKWAGLSRRVWAIALMVLGGIAQVPELGSVGPFLAPIQDVGSSLFNLAAAVVALWSAFRPDNAKLKALPTVLRGNG